MHRILWVPTVVVAALALVVTETRSVARDPVHALPAVRSEAPAPLSFSLANAYKGDPGDRRARSVSFQNRRSVGQHDLAEMQSVDAFTSLEDGQPGDPGEWELEFDFSSITTSDESDPITLETELQYTFSGSEFLRNMQLSLEVPVETGNGEVDGNGDIEFEWQQRWVTEDGTLPTLATVLEARFPSGFQSNGVDVGLTGIVAKEWGPGTFYFNGLIESANGENEEDLRDVQWAFRTGYKWRLDQTLALIFDYVVRSSEEHGDPAANLVELAAEYHVNDHLTIGPGVMIGVDDQDTTPNFGAGVRVVYGF